MKKLLIQKMNQLLDQTKNKNIRLIIAEDIRNLKLSKNQYDHLQMALKYSTFFNINFRNFYL